VVFVPTAQEAAPYQGTLGVVEVLP
jgi:hypothetical protein